MEGGYLGKGRRWRNKGGGGYGGGGGGEMEEVAEGEGEDVVLTVLHPIPVSCWALPILDPLIVTSGHCSHFTVER